jgi:hypothetical protein
MAGEYEPNDSRNVTGTGSSQDGCWTNQAGSPPNANGQPQQTEGDRNFRQAGEGFGEQSGGAGQAGDQGQARQFDQSSGQFGAGQSGAEGKLSDQIREHMEVIGEDGESLGRVDSLDGERIKLTRADSEDGQHHFINCSDVAGIENNQVHLHAGARALPGNDGS